MNTMTKENDGLEIAVTARSDRGLRSQDVKSKAATASRFPSIDAVLSQIDLNLDLHEYAA